MAWLFGKKKEELSDFQKARQRQVEELLKSVPNCRLVSGAGVTAGAAAASADFITYEVSAMSVYGRIPFTVILSPSFPERAPSFQLLLARYTHRWLVDPPATQAIAASSGLDPNYPIIHHPKLTTWFVNSSLANMVNELLNEFTRNPPTPHNMYNRSPQPQQPQPSNIHTQSTLTTSSSSSSSLSVSTQPSQPPLSPYFAAFGNPSPAASSLSLNNNNKNPSLLSANLNFSLNLPPSSHQAKLSIDRPSLKPQIPTDFPILDTFTIAELESLVASSHGLEYFAWDDESVKTASASLSQLMSSVESLTKQNEQLGASVADKRAAVQLLTQQLTEAQQVSTTLQSRQQAVLSRFQLAGTLAALTTAIEQSEADSDKISDAFKLSESGAAGRGESAGMATANKFVDDYLKARMLVHMRSAKKERLQEAFGR